MEANDAGRSALIYLFALTLGASSPTPATVFFKTQGEPIAQSLCALFIKEYGPSDGRPSFLCQPADVFTFVEQVLLDEAIAQLDVYAEPNLLYDPAPSVDTLRRAQFAFRARRWEHLLKQRASAQAPISPKVPSPSAIQLGRPGGPCFVLGREKRPLTDAQRAVVARLLDAGRAGLTKDALELVRPSARRILRALRQDPDWAQVIGMANQTNGRYRIWTDQNPSH